MLCVVACGVAGVPGAAWCVVGPGCLVCRWVAARPRAVRAASFARRVVSKPGQAPPPPTGTAARPSGPSGALHAGGAFGAVWCRPGPATAHGHRGRPLRCPSHRRRVVADVWWGVLFRFPARPRHRLPAPLQVPPGPSASVALAASAWQFRMQFPDACGQPLCEKPGILTIGFRTMKCIRGNCMRMCADQAVPPRCSALGAKKFALRRCVIAKARKSSPCALKTPQIWCFVLAGRTFSRKGRCRGGAGRVFSRLLALRPGVRFFRRPPHHQ